MEGKVMAIAVDREANPMDSISIQDCQQWFVPRIEAYKGAMKGPMLAAAFFVDTARGQQQP